MAKNGKSALVRSGLIIAVLLSGGCSTPSAEYSSDLERHYQFSDDLQAMMLRMDRLVHDRQLTGSEIDSIRARQGEIVQQLASQLQRNSDDLIKGQGGSHLSSLEEVQFRAIANQLGISAERFSHFSRYGSNEEIERAYEEMTSACTACHLLYRDER